MGKKHALTLSAEQMAAFKFTAPASAPEKNYAEFLSSEDAYFGIQANDQATQAAAPAEAVKKLVLEPEAIFQFTAGKYDPEYWSLFITKNEGRIQKKDYLPLFADKKTKKNPFIAGEIYEALLYTPLPIRGVRVEAWLEFLQKKCSAKKMFFGGNLGLCVTESFLPASKHIFCPGREPMYPDASEIADVQLKALAKHGQLPMLYKIPLSDVKTDLLLYTLAKTSATQMTDCSTLIFRNL